MGDFKDSHSTDIFHTLGTIPKSEVPNFVEFDTVYEFRGVEHFTFKLSKGDNDVVRVMDRGDGTLSARSLMNSIEPENTKRTEEKTD